MVTLSVDMGREVSGILVVVQACFALLWIVVFADELTWVCVE